MTWENEHDDWRFAYYGARSIQNCSVIIYPSLVKSKSVLGNFKMGIPGHTHFFPLVAKIVTFRVLIWSMFTISGANNVKKKGENHIFKKNCVSV